jgi:hypothetical protein
MPDTLTPEQIAAIREQDAHGRTPANDCIEVWRDRRALLAHIDTLTTENERLREGIKIMQDNWPKTVLAPMDRREPQDA